MKTINKITVVNKIYKGEESENNSTIVYVDDEYLGTYCLSDVNLIKDLAEKMEIDVKIDFNGLMSKEDLVSQVDDRDW